MILSTTLKAKEPSMLSVAIDNACAPLEPSRCKGALALINGGIDVGIPEYEAVLDRLRELLPKEADVVVGSVIRADWPEGRRITSLTLTGDRESS